MLVTWTPRSTSLTERFANVGVEVGDVGDDVGERLGLRRGPQP